MALDKYRAAHWLYFMPDASTGNFMMGDLAVAPDRLWVQAKAWSDEWRDLLHEMAADNTRAFQDLSACRSPLEVIKIEQDWLLARGQSWFNSSIRLARILLGAEPKVPSNVPGIFTPPVMSTIADIPVKPATCRTRYPIEAIEGIGPANAERLAGACVTDTEALLALCGAPAGRKAIAEQTGLSVKVLLKWTNMADLMRLKGVGAEFSELLEQAGVDTVKELKMRVAANLHAKLAETNKAKKLTRRTPTEHEVETWIAEAKMTAPAISY